MSPILQTLGRAARNARASILEDLLSCQQGLAALWHGQQAHQPSATALSALSSPHPVWQHSSHRHYAGRITEDPKEKQRRVKEAQRAAKGAAPQVDATATAPVETATPTRVEKSILEVSVPSSKLTEEHLGNYYKLKPSLIPEAFPAVYNAFYTHTDKQRKRRGGCMSLQREMEATFTTKSNKNPPLLMHRPVAADVWATLAGRAGSEGGNRILLRGPTGSGKSLTVAAVVERARASGWTVLYIPSARVFLRGGLFEPRMPPDGSEPQEWDTPIQAQQLLLGMQQAHGDTLQSTPARLESTCALLAALRQDVTAQASGAAAPAAAATAAQGEGEDSQAAASSSGSSSQPAAESAASTSAAAAGGQDTLGELLTLGQATTDPHLPVDAALALMDELVAMARVGAASVLFAIDDYNALYWHTDYGVHVQREGSQDKDRVPLKVEQLRLARAMRLLVRPPSSLDPVQVLAANSQSAGVSARVRVPFPNRPTHHTVFAPRFSKEEVAHMLYHYYECGLMAHPPSEVSVARSLLLTNGNGDELRKLAHMEPLLKLNMPTSEDIPTTRIRTWAI